MTRRRAQRRARRPTEMHEAAHSERGAARNSPRHDMTDPQGVRVPNMTHGTNSPRGVRAAHRAHTPRIALPIASIPRSAPLTASPPHVIERRIARPPRTTVVLAVAPHGMAPRVATRCDAAAHGAKPHGAAPRTAARHEHRICEPRASPCSRCAFLLLSQASMLASHHGSKLCAKRPSEPPSSRSAICRSSNVSTPPRSERARHPSRHRASPGQAAPFRIFIKLTPHGPSFRTAAEPFAKTAADQRLSPWCM